MPKRSFLYFIVMVMAPCTIFAQTEKGHWVDSVFNAMSTEEKIGQLFMLVVPTNASRDVVDKIKDEIKNHDAGGIKFTRESPHHQASITKELQGAASIPLLVGQDGEWGVGQQVDSAMSFPRPLLLGAIQEDSLIYNMGREIARQMKILGVNINFAPLAEINNDPQDPLISYRSFGENKMNVGNKATAFMRGLQDNNVLACAKQYGVKGITITDFENDIPRVQATVDTIRSYPFQKLFENNVAGVMPAASPVPLFYENARLNRKNEFDASTMSLLFTGRWLKEKQNFKGLSFVELQLVKIAADKSKEGDEAVFAFQAGNDVLIGPGEVGPAIRKIKKMIKTEDQYQTQLDTSVRKILSAKYDAGLHHPQYINLDNLDSRLNAPSGVVLKQKLYEKAVTVLKNERKILPITSLENKHIAYITSDVSVPNGIFYDYLTKYAAASYFTLDEKSDLVELSDAIAGHQVVIVGIFPQTQPAVVARIERLLSMLQPTIEVIFCDFGNESFLRTASKYNTAITAYCNTPETLK
ncbi:MAG TPA: glycoside hydrolase family 3 N-terminal domain-containing protein, partial [Chryseolinea sp.]|nr:glycoside hydrolase family 3 N-terminal domain-containing protein [Chryseolinea sp.]